MDALAFLVAEAASAIGTECTDVTTFPNNRPTHQNTTYSTVVLHCSLASLSNRIHKGQDNRAAGIPKAAAPQLTAQKVGRSVGGGGDRPTEHPTEISVTKVASLLCTRAHLTTYMRVMFLHPTS